MPHVCLENLSLVYEPYPIGVIAPAFEPGFYAEMMRAFPPVEMFKAFQEQVARKYSLSEYNNPRKYHEFIAKTPLWGEVRRYFKSEDFIYSVIESLRGRGVDLGIRRKNQMLPRRALKFARSALQGRLPSAEGAISARFEFSCLPANGGFVVPHTDAPNKFVTIVFSIVGDEEWQSEWGGGTDILRTKDAAKSFNFFNKRVSYDETETLSTVEFRPNQAMLFVKTFNSLHGVKVMTGPEGTLRRTLTVNFERG